ncbi:sensor histidine kinase [Streptomyces sp. NRRL S-1448]|uniref:sensor histidine kinase n=1 Tax=Streptomyces sp. NRRL S-1448 TaxID=1463883 RepID=UPI0005690469|nr:histidine kinase [Streptomyces sp. NRRL S-1448]
MQRVTLYTRWALCAIPWFFPLSFAGPVTHSLRERPVSTPLMWVLISGFVAQTVLATVVLAHRVGRRRTLRGLTAAVVVFSCLHFAALPVLHSSGWPAEASHLDYYCLLAAAPLAAVLNATSVQTYSAVGAALAVLAFVVAAATGFALHDAAVTFLAVAASWVVIGLALRSSVWYLSVMWQLDAAREAQGHLAVAEERLRFARDLHDVMGRNLAVIALKSELATRLSEVNDPRAGVEMAEVQRLARQSQNEIRDVVRGYRSTDLASEIAGARSVLQAAGITSTIESDLSWALSKEAQSVLGWVIREGVTNILRHSEARHCTIRVTESDGPELIITNDRAHPGSSADGTGLAGLAQRLAPLGGTLQHGAGPANTYSLAVRLPSSLEQKAQP